MNRGLRLQTTTIYCLLNKVYLIGLNIVLNLTSI